MQNKVKVIVEIICEVKNIIVHRKWLEVKLTVFTESVLYIVTSEQSINSVRVEIRLSFPVTKEDKILSFKCKSLVVWR